MKVLNKKELEFNIKSIAQHDIDKGNTFGLAYIVKQNGMTMFENYFGYTQPQAYGKVSKDTIFRIASMTKPVTAVAVLILIERQLISLDTVVKKFFPQLDNVHIVDLSGKDIGKTKADITIMHLLTHTSGLGSLKPANIPSKAKKTIEKTVEYFAREGLDFEPFANQAYSPIAAFDVLAGIVEKVTGEDYEEFLKREVFAPCNMKNTTFKPQKEQQKRIITMHDRKNENIVGKTTEGCVFEDYPYSHKLGGAGLVSTLLDYSNFVEMLLNKGKTEKGRLFSEETFRLLPKVYVSDKMMPGDEQWGLGVRVVTGNENCILPIGTYGWSGAYGTHFWVDPENNITAVLMKNSRYDDGEGTGANASSARRFEKAVYDSLKG